MRSRTPLYVLVGLLILALSGIWYFYTLREQPPARIFSAAINRDCAPWDGAAFTVSIPYTSGTIIYISIWQSPDMKLPTTFTFPDQTGRVGNATYLLRYSHYVQLTGKVSFRRVEQGIPVEGRFDLLTENGQQLKGQFEAQWGDLIAYCG